MNVSRLTGSRAVVTSCQSTVACSDVKWFGSAFAFGCDGQVLETTSSQQVLCGELLVEYPIGSAGGAEDLVLHSEPDHAIIWEVSKSSELLGGFLIEDEAMLNGRMGYVFGTPWVHCKTRSLQ